MWMLLCLGVCAGALAAQDCDLSCYGPDDQPVSIVLDDNCRIAITTNVLVPDLASCPGVKRLTVRDSLNNLVADNFDLVQFVASAYVGSRLSVTITDQVTGTFCISIVRIVDNTAPTIAACDQVTVNCFDSASPDVIGYPTVSDNCAVGLVPTFIDNVVLRDCLSDTAGIIYRDWTVTHQGLTATCRQQINILRVSSMNVTFPDHITLPCNDPDAPTSRTGVPQLNGMPIMHQGFCGLDVSFEDDTINICNAYMYRIDRTWTVTENCTDFFAEHTQQILVSDNQGPVMSCPTAPLVYNTDPDDCSATVLLPGITATDNCGDSLTFSVATSYGANSFIARSGVPVGTHQVLYRATDECGNESTCTVQLTVVDDLAPVAACDDQVLASIPSSGYALLSASVFDEGSTDNCQSVFLKVRRNETGACDGANGDDSAQLGGVQEWFDDRVVFCCSDIPNSPIAVTLRVYEANPGTGAVNPNRETGNGDLVGHYTDCQSIVTLQDASVPSFPYCPPPVTIQCTDEQDDLGIYGSAQAYDNCGFTIDSTFTTNLSDCHVGTITRTWTATDIYGGSATCTQVITVQNNVHLLAEHITWPENIDLVGCGTSTDIEDLPLANREPVINFDGCGTVAVNMTEATFTTVPGACYKVLRTWTVIDWCHYNSELTNGPGRYTRTQIIKVVDNTSPVISCPAPVTVNVSTNCTTAPVTLGLPTAEDCSAQIAFTNNSPYATSAGANASGTYPVGTTTVRFIANDGCSNNAACTTTVTVADIQPPSIACVVGLTVNVMPTLEGGPMGMLQGSALVVSSADNCTPASLIKYTIARPGDGTIGVPTATTMLFDCQDAGDAVLVEVWATDNLNNSASCTTIVMVQDPNGLCAGQVPGPSPNTNPNPSPNPTTGGGNGMIAGGVLTEEGDEVENVMVAVAGPAQGMMYTNLDGSFAFDALPTGSNYNVSAENNEGLLNGVTTLDLILIGRHILGTRFLDSPYKLIAADTDRSGHISTLDIIRLRKLILNIDNQLPNGNTSWRFVDASYEFPDPTNPFLTYFPEVYNVSNLTGMEMHADFVAIKVGDVNGSAVANSRQLQGNERSQGFAMDIQVAEKTVTVGETVDIVFTSDYMNEWMGYQFTLEYNPTALDVLEIIPGNIPNLYAEENFNHYDKRAGLITTVWNEYGESAASTKGTILFTLRCTAQQAGNIKEWLYLSSRVTKAEAVTQEAEPQNINLSFVSAAVESATAFELFQNRPNPWTNSTVIPFQLDPGGDASLSVYDMAGKVVYRVEGNYTAGYHEISISRNNLPAAGLFYYTLEAGAQRATRKMVLTD